MKQEKGERTVQPSSLEDFLEIRDSLHIPGVHHRQEDERDDFREVPPNSVFLIP